MFSQRALDALSARRHQRGIAVKRSEPLAGACGTAAGGLAVEKSKKGIGDSADAGHHLQEFIGHVVLLQKATGNNAIPEVSLFRTYAFDEHPGWRSGEFLAMFQTAHQNIIELDHSIS